MKEISKIQNTKQKTKNKRQKHAYDSNSSNMSPSSSDEEGASMVLRSIFPFRRPVPTRFSCLASASVFVACFKLKGQERHKEGEFAPPPPLPPFKKKKKGSSQPGCAVLFFFIKAQTFFRPRVCANNAKMRGCVIKDACPMNASVAKMTL